MNNQNTTSKGFKAVSTEKPNDESREVFDWYVTNFQFVPNLAQVMAASPALLRSYWQTQLNLQKFGKLSAAENNIVQMSIAMKNECKYCVSGHHLAGRIFFGTPETVMEEIRSGAEISDTKFSALQKFALLTYEKRGQISEEDMSEFLRAGYTREQALDVVTNIATKVMSNFTNHMAGTELDEPIKPFAIGLKF